MPRAPRTAHAAGPRAAAAGAPAPTGAPTGAPAASAHTNTRKSTRSIARDRDRDRDRASAPSPPSSLIHPPSPAQKPKPVIECAAPPAAVAPASAAVAVAVAVAAPITQPKPQPQPQPKQKQKAKRKRKPKRKPKRILDLPPHLKYYQTRLQHARASAFPKPYAITLRYVPYPPPDPYANVNVNGNGNGNYNAGERRRSQRTGAGTRTHRGADAEAEADRDTTQHAFQALYFPKPGVSIAFSDGAYCAASFVLPAPPPAPLTRARTHTNTGTGNRRGKQASNEHERLQAPTHVVRLALPGGAFASHRPRPPGLSWTGDERASPTAPASAPTTAVLNAILSPYARHAGYDPNTDSEDESDSDDPYDEHLHCAHPTGARFVRVVANPPPTPALTPSVFTPSGGALAARAHAQHLHAARTERAATTRLSARQLGHVFDFLGLALPDRPEPREEWAWYPNARASDPVHVLVTAPAPRQLLEGEGRERGGEGVELTQSAKDIAAVLVLWPYLPVEELREALFRLEDMAWAESDS